MIRSLRWRLFAAIVGTVLVAVGASLALGIVLTRDAVKDTIRKDVSSQADVLALRLRSGELRSAGAGPAVPGVLPPLPGGLPAQAPGVDQLPLPPPGGPGVSIPVIVSLSRASSLLPPPVVAALRAGRPVDGTFTRRGEDEVFAARRAGSRVVLVTRPDVVSGDDFSRYLTALLLSSGIAVLLAAGAAALLARRLSAPLHRVAEASRELAAGGSPDPVPREETLELAALADAFNEMSVQLQSAREAERAIFLSVSHELRTPLTSIRGYAEGIEDGTVDPRAAAAVVGREAGRLERLVLDLLALARLRQGTLDVRAEPVDLAQAAREAQERLLPQARAAGVEVRVEGERVAPVRADHGRLVQVLSNLVENAIRAAPEGSAVTVAVAADRVTVTDRGPGIPGEELGRAFERFHLRRRQGGGSPDGAGTGLAIVRELTEAMGGEVSVSNGASGGAAFTVRLPRTGAGS